MLHVVSAVVDLDQRESARLTGMHRLSRELAGLYSSLAFVLLHLLGISVWVVVNSAHLGVRHVDPFPFPLLAVCVGIEVLVLSTFVLSAQRAETARAERRAQVMLHLETLVERETTTLIRMVSDLRADLGLLRDDAQAQALQATTDVARVADAFEEAGKGE